MAMINFFVQMVAIEERLLRIEQNKGNGEHGEFEEVEASVSWQKPPHQ
jgi:hypothetical protein